MSDLFVGKQAKNGWRYGMVWCGFVSIVWYGGFQMASEFIHEEISIMDYHRGWGVMTGMDCYGLSQTGYFIY